MLFRLHQSSSVLPVVRVCLRCMAHLQYIIAWESTTHCVGITWYTVGMWRSQNSYMCAYLLRWLASNVFTHKPYLSPVLSPLTSRFPEYRFHSHTLSPVPSPPVPPPPLAFFSVVVAPLSFVLLLPFVPTLIACLGDRWVDRCSIR